MADQSSLSGQDDLIMAAYTFAQLGNPTPAVLQEVEDSIARLTVEHVYLSGAASSDFLMPYISLLRKYKIPFTIVELLDANPQVALEILRDASL